jgi:hypothetical protein
MKVDEYIVKVFDFLHVFLASYGAVCYFTHMTLEFWRSSSLIWRAMDEVGYGELIATNEQWKPISQGSISIH